MIVEVVGGADERPEVRVVDTDDLTRLHLALGQVTDEEADEVLRQAGLGRLQDDGTGLLDAAALRAAAEPDADVAALHAAAQPRASSGDWQAQWDVMIAKARSKGWLSEDGASIQVHVESAAGA